LPKPITEGRGIAFLGGFNHRPNVDAAITLAREIMPHLRQVAPGVGATIAGADAPEEVRALSAPDVRIAGFVPNLVDLFATLRCTVAPLRYGAGVKGKVLESFAHGLPCVMSEIAAEGLNLPEDLAWLVARSPEEFAVKIAALHDDDTMAVRLAGSCRAYIVENNNTDETTERMRRAIVIPGQVLV
jgi:glycosyltransferase involved in cell wall biosynthesis